MDIDDALRLIKMRMRIDVGNMIDDDLIHVLIETNAAAAQGLIGSSADIADLLDNANFFNAVFVMVSDQYNHNQSSGSKQEYSPAVMFHLSLCRNYKIL